MDTGIFPGALDAALNPEIEESQWLRFSDCQSNLENTAQQNAALENFWNDNIDINTLIAHPGDTQDYEVDPTSPARPLEILLLPRSDLLEFYEHNRIYNKNVEARSL